MKFHYPQQLFSRSLRTRYSIKLPDAVIAGTAISDDLKLMTRNLADFERVAGLHVVNPFVMAI